MIDRADSIRRLKGIADIKHQQGINLKPLKPLKKASEKRKIANKELARLVKIFLAKHKTCQIQGADCTRIATCVHHSAGRIGEKLLDVKFFMASCVNCNLDVEKNDAWARENGFKKSKFK